MTEQPRVQKGVPTGGRYAATHHAESGVNLAAPDQGGLSAQERVGLERRLHDLQAAAEHAKLLRGALWADSIRKAAPGAATAVIRAEGDGVFGAIEAVVPFDADGNELPIDRFEARRLADSDTAADALGRGERADLAGLERLYATYTDAVTVAVAVASRNDPEHNRRLAIEASRIEAKAVQGHVEAISAGVLEQDPEAVAVVVDGTDDSVEGRSYRLAYAVRADGEHSPASLEGPDEILLQGRAFDEHVVFGLDLDEYNEILNVPLAGGQAEAEE